MTTEIIEATDTTTGIMRAITMCTVIMTATKCVAGMTITTGACLRAWPREIDCLLGWNGS